jgi:structural maintenance of chromosome 3 (chondroitin sulfate proteoglycan 6)
VKLSFISILRILYLYIATFSQIEQDRRNKQEIEKINIEISKANLELERIDPIFNEKSSNLEKSRERLSNFQRRSEMLYGKQGRGRQFSTADQRNAYLEAQIDELQKTVKGKRDLKKKLQSESTKEDAQIKKEEAQVNLAENEKKKKVQSVEELSQRISRITEQRNMLQEKRKDSWRQMEELQEAISEAKRDLQRGKDALDSSLPKHVSAALALVERIASEQNLKGYYGPVVDNFSLKNDAFRTAVEVAAGNSLFNVIVDTEKTAAFLMKELERRKAGRLTFLPLNQLRVQPVTYPDTTDARPLIEVAIQFDEKFTDVMKQVTV